MRIKVPTRIVWLSLAMAATLCTRAESISIETPFLRFSVAAENGSYVMTDKMGGVTWQSNPFEARFGEVTFNLEGKQRRANLGPCEIKQDPAGLVLSFQPVPERPELWLRVAIAIGTDQKSLELSYETAGVLRVESVRLLDRAFWVNDSDKGYVTVPVREGMLVPADSGFRFIHRFDTFAYEGCHMQMLGVVKSGAAALLTWRDCYVAAELESVVMNSVGLPGRQVLSPSLVLSKSAKSFRVQVLGKGNYVTIANAYRQHAQENGLRITWDEKLRGEPNRAKLLGAINFKLWSTLDRRMNEASSKEERVTVNWTFDEAAQVAEHLKRDLKLDKVLFTMGGWIHRGYDNQHPDILPSAPECGGDAAFADCARRVRDLGYLFCLHDNYQDIYRDSPSWDERFIMKNREGNLMRGGHWGGGVAYLTCSEKALELAKRPQNLFAVKKLCAPNAYFIDTTYAAGLQECFDKEHPLTRSDDMKWKQALSDFARDVFGVFGSECGREWAIPHSDFFEGLTGVSGRSYHDSSLASKLGGVPIPLFEMVYRDCIALYGKYGYDPFQSAEYVLHHLSIGRPLHYHNIPADLYWTEPSRAAEPLQVCPTIRNLIPLGPREFEITYGWTVEKTPASDWRVFVHFTDAAGNIRFQNDYEPAPPVSQWTSGEVVQRPRRVQIPDGVTGTYEIRTGLFKAGQGRRAVLLGTDEDGERSYVIGKLRIASEKIEFEPVRSAPAKGIGDPAIFTRAHGGWADGLHPLDRFVKNTAEILSPLHELTAKTLVTAHEFLTTDRHVQRTVFGMGANAMQVIVNSSSADFRCRTLSGGDVLLPPYGFVVDGPEFVAFIALEFGGLRYESPALFTVRPLDSRPIRSARRLQVFHGFGDARLRWGKETHTIAREGLTFPIFSAPRPLER